MVDVHFLRVAVFTFLLLLIAPKLADCNLRAIKNSCSALFPAALSTPRLLQRVVHQRNPLGVSVLQNDLHNGNRNKHVEKLYDMYEL